MSSVTPPSDRILRERAPLPEIRELEFDDDDVKPRKTSGNKSQSPKSQRGSSESQLIHETILQRKKKHERKEKRTVSELKNWTRSPFPEFLGPTVDEACHVLDLLQSTGGVVKREWPIVDLPGAQSGCGEVPNVTDGVIRTVLSTATLSSSATRQKNAMDVQYGRGNHRAVLEGGVTLLSQTLSVAGLSQKKASSILGLLEWLDEKEGGTGDLSLEYLRDLPSDMECVRILLSIPGVGVKVTSCMLLMCLDRPWFPVDTHVLRLTGMLGWLPPECLNDPNQAFYHLNDRIPDDIKYALHNSFIRHGRGCIKCSPSGISAVAVSHCSIDELVKLKRPVRKVVEKKVKSQEVKSSRKNVGTKKKTLKSQKKGWTKLKDEDEDIEQHGGKGVVKLLVRAGEKDEEPKSEAVKRSLSVIFDGDPALKRVR